MSTKVPLTSLKAGDEFLVKARVTHTDSKDTRRALIHFKMEGSKDFNVSYHSDVEDVKVEKITPPKTTVEIGDQFKGAYHLFEVIGMYKDSCWYINKETEHKFSCASAHFLSDGYTFLGNINDSEK